METTKLSKLERELSQCKNELTSEDRTTLPKHLDHEMYYGLQGVAHVYLMKNVSDYANGEKTFEAKLDLYDKFGPIFGEGSGFSAMVDGTQDGIRFPFNELQFFSRDYFNRMIHPSWTDRADAKELMSRDWKAKDLENPELAKQGIRFGKDIWQTTVAYWNENKMACSPNAVQYGDKLIAYYSALITELEQ